MLLIGLTQYGGAIGVLRIDWPYYKAPNVQTSATAVHIGPQVCHLIAGIDLPRPTEFQLIRKPGDGTLPLSVTIRPPSLECVFDGDETEK